MGYKIKSFPLFIYVFFAFFGYYAGLILMSNVGLIEASRLFTIPIRVIMIFALIMGFVFNRRHVSGNQFVYLIFFFFYFLTIISDYYNAKPYYRSTSEILFYFISFSLIPFLTLTSIKLQHFHYNVIKWALVISGFLFSLIGLFSFQKFIGQVGRLTTVSGVSDELINPLLLSYCSSLAMGISISILIYNSPAFKEKILHYCIIGLSIVPFFLGASRGSLIGLFIPFFYIMIVKNTFILNLKAIIYLAIAIMAIVYIGELLGSGLIDRFIGTSSSFSSGSESEIRSGIWKSSLEQFSNNPLFGDKFEVNGWINYPHNLFIDVMQVSGIAGLIPFSILIFRTFNTVTFIFKKVPEYSWLGIIFIQNFMQYMFSGAVYTADWLWASMALVLSFRLLYTGGVNK